MKELFFDEKNKLNSKLNAELIDSVCQINLSRDIVISTPTYNNDKSSCKFNGYGFNIFNSYTMDSDKYNTFIVSPLIKLTIPNGLKPVIDSKINGLYISENIYKSYEGVIIKSEDVSEILMNNTSDNDFNKLEVYTNTIDYIYVDYIKLIFREYNRQLFLKEISKLYKNSTKLPPFSLIADMYFVQTFIGNNICSQIGGEVYLIHSDYIFNNFPNFGGFK